MFKKSIAGFLSLVLTALCFLTGCQSDTAVTSAKAEQSTDKFRNFYQIFVYSYNDSNGDGKGDIPGIIDKLDYLNDGDPNGGDDLGIDGIWLTPIMQSPAYHKYSVEDYMSIDEDFGTMEDFEKLVSGCKDRGINLIIDLVLNHSSNTNPWFTKAVEEVKQGNLDGYAKYYHIVKEDEQADGSTYTKIDGTDYYYESNFDVSMPELNLGEPKLREEIKEILKFWIDKGVAGFRLDAIKYYNTGGDDGNEFLTWLYNTAKEMKDDIYMVGEDWAGKTEITGFYDTGIDSVFNFPMSGVDGTFESVTRSGNAASLVKNLQKWQQTITERNANAIDATFLSNHDTVRSASSFGKDLVDEKTAAMLYMLVPGNSYMYYGEEVGLGGSGQQDANYRIPMPWSGGEAENLIIPNLNLTDAEEAVDVTVEEAQKDSNSLFYFYKKIIDIKLQNPQIARGTIKDIVEGESSSTAGYITEYDGTSVMVFYNLADETKTVEISKDKLDYSAIVGQATALDPDDNGDYPKAELKDTTLTIPSKSVVILGAV